MNLSSTRGENIYLSLCLSGTESRVVHREDSVTATEAGPRHRRPSSTRTLQGGTAASVPTTITDDKDNEASLVPHYLSLASQVPTTKGYAKERPLHIRDSEVTKIHKEIEMVR